MTTVKYRVIITRYDFCTEYFSGCGSAWGRVRAPPVADEARTKEWQQLGDWQASTACADRTLVATGSERVRRCRWQMKANERSEETRRISTGRERGDYVSRVSLESALKTKIAKQNFHKKTKKHFGVWLSLVERLVRDQEVGCSNHLTPTRSSVYRKTVNTR